MNIWANEAYLPKDHARQSTSYEMVRQVLPRFSGSVRVCDLGCGPGDSVDFFRQQCPGVHWVGVDIDDSPEVRSRKRSDAEFLVFDGINIPLPSESVDIVFCHQVLEHVRFPAQLLTEVRRVLRPGGVFVGEVSHLEPYHSYSLWNFTPYGLRNVCEEAGLSLESVRPGIDGMTLQLFYLLGGPRFFARWWSRESPLNLFLSIYARLRRRTVDVENRIKLAACGQFSFVANRENPFLAKGL